VYFPEVIWAVMFNVMGCSSKKVNNTRLAKEIIKALPRKYEFLYKVDDLSMDYLNGNLDLA